MADLFSAEYYKLWKSVGFRTCFIVFFGCDILATLIISFAGGLLGVDITGYVQFSNLLTGFSGSSVAGMLFGFVAASLITSDYKSRDIQCAIAQGYSRGRILMVKIIVYITAIFILSMEDVILYTVGGTISGGFGVAMTGEVALYMLRAMLCEGFVIAMMYMTCVFLAFALTSKAASVALNLLVFFVIDMGIGMLPYITKSEKLGELLEYLPFKSVSEMGMEYIDWSHGGISLIVAAVYGASMILATWLVFRKKDLR